MAYRFLLEVPGTLAPDANVAVDLAGDAQVILVRDSHGLGFDDPYADLTIAAHSLRVLDTLYDWFDELGASRPDIRIVLHSGERLTLESHERGDMVAAIRRDQPWVDRSIPKIGDHEADEFDPIASSDTGLAENEDMASTIDAMGDSAPGILSAMSPVSSTAIATERSTESAIRIRDLNHIAVQVPNLAKAEQFYAEFLGMRVVGRSRRGADSRYERLPEAETERNDGRIERDAAVTFLRNGPLTLALLWVGGGARLERGVVDHLSVAVDAATFATLKGEALMRPLTIIHGSDASITILDPFGVTWEVTVRGSVMQ